MKERMRASTPIQDIFRTEDQYIFDFLVSADKPNFPSKTRKRDLSQILETRHNRDVATHKSRLKDPTLTPTDEMTDCSCENTNYPNAMMARSVRPMMAVAVMLLLCSHGGEAGPSFTSKRNLRGSSFPEFMDGLEVIATISDGSIDDEICHGRPRNRSLAREHDEAWYHQCHLHLSHADTQAPSGQWTMSEFTDFLQLHIHTKFKQLPLPFTMIFNELSCRCLQYDHENSDCCLGGKARLAPDIGVDDITWMSTICNRVDYALDEVCRRQQVHRSEL